MTYTVLDFSLQLGLVLATAGIWEKKKTMDGKISFSFSKQINLTNLNMKIPGDLVGLECSRICGKGFS